MTAAALLQSILTSLPEIVVVVGACVLLILGQLVPKGQGQIHAGERGAAGIHGHVHC